MRPPSTVVPSGGWQNTASGNYSNISGGNSLTVGTDYYWATAGYSTP